MENFANNINVSTSSSSSSSFSGYSYYAIIAIALVLVSVGAYVAFWRSYWTYDNIWSWWNPPAISLTELGVLQQVSVPLPVPLPVPYPVPGAAATASTSERRPEGPKESWCFVGEDLTGRYCVKVPSDKSCDRDRLFGNQKDCELTTANHMPAGIVKSNGTSMLPLANMRFG